MKFEEGFPTIEDNPKGLQKRYNVRKIGKDGIVRERDQDPNAKYFVLRLDNYGEKNHVLACRAALKLYADLIGIYLPELSEDIKDNYDLSDNWVNPDEQDVEEDAVLAPPPLPEPTSQVYELDVDDRLGLMSEGFSTEMIDLCVEEVRSLGISSDSSFALRGYVGAVFRLARDGQYRSEFMIKYNSILEPRLPVEGIVTDRELVDSEERDLVYSLNPTQEGVDIGETTVYDNEIPQETLNTDTPSLPDCEENLSDSTPDPGPPPTPEALADIPF
jgi:hypothetical protein